MILSDMTVIQIGVYPPPFGGTTVHNQRLTKYCREQGIRTIFIDPSGLDDGRGRGALPPPVYRLGGPLLVRYWKLWRLLKLHPRAVVHVHASVFRSFTIAGYPMLTLLNGRPAILSIQAGNFPAVYSNSPGWRRLLIRGLIQQFDAIVVTQSTHARFVAEACELKRERVHVIPSFIPNAVVPTERCTATIAQVRELRQRFRNLVLVTGQVLGFYGLETFVTGLGLLSKREDPWGFVLALYRGLKPPDVELDRWLMEQADALGNGLVLRNLQSDDFGRVLEECRIFVRPTTMEGDSNALREAAAAGLQIVASDCAPRPVGVALFPTGDAKALAHQVEQCLSDRSYGRVRESIEGNGEQFIALYRDLWTMRYGAGKAYAGVGR